MPLVWGLLEFFQCLVEIIYSKIYEMSEPKGEKISKKEEVKTDN